MMMMLMPCISLSSQLSTNGRLTARPSMYALARRLPPTCSTDSSFQTSSAVSRHIRNEQSTLKMLDYPEEKFYPTGYTYPCAAFDSIQDGGPHCPLMCISSRTRNSFASQLKLPRFQLNSCCGVE
ncbi:hypothetical protein Mapa_014472 [Marchantia paleacea]|nr:hypothetical protein Mapa_014472 [Marchantia paleacea]